MSVENCMSLVTTRNYQLVMGLMLYRELGERMGTLWGQSCKDRLGLNEEPLKELVRVGSFKGAKPKELKHYKEPDFPSLLPTASGTDKYLVLKLTKGNAGTKKVAQCCN